jgi:hypothetical protein
MRLSSAGSKVDSKIEAVGKGAQWSLRSLRSAVRSHDISFPSQVPVFRHLHRPDIQWRIVLLYLVQGWSSQQIGARYGITRKRVAQLVRQWTSHARLRGYLEPIPSEEECLGFQLAAGPTQTALAPSGPAHIYFTGFHYAPPSNTGGLVNRDRS